MAKPAPPTAAITRRPYVPMTPRERVGHYFYSTFGPEAFVRSAFGAGINQWLDTPKEWGQGAEGYGRRFASTFGGHVVQTTVMDGMGALIHEDNRYFQSGETGFGRRLDYALTSTVLARHDDGSRHVSISRLTSLVAAAAISRAWQPASTRGAIHGVDAFAIGLGAEMGLNVVREFFPKILHSRPPVALSAH